MAKIILSALLLLALAASAPPCRVTANYRCTNGRAGLVFGRGNTTLDAKEDAREQTRMICQEAIDYIRFVESASDY